MKLPILQVSLIVQSSRAMPFSVVWNFHCFRFKIKFINWQPFSMCRLIGLSNITMVYHSYLVPPLRFLLSKYTHPYPSERRVTSCYGIHVL